MSIKFTISDAIQQVELFKPKLAMLVASSSSLQPTDGVDKVLKVHADALVVKEGVVMLLPYAINIQRPVSVADGNTILAIVKDLQKSWNILVDNAINQKSFFDLLPVGNITALITQDFKLSYNAISDLANACVDAAPAELQTEAKATRQSYEDTMKKFMAAYQ